MSCCIELEKERRTVSILKEGLEQSQQLTATTVNQINKEHKQRLSTQKIQYEETINRHQGFIDQLIADKKLISETCESMATELRTLEKRNRDNIKAMETRHLIGNFSLIH